MVGAESLVESDAIILFEFSRGVIRFQEQPELIKYEFEGEIRRYYPDFEVELRNGKTIHFEVKPKSKLASPELIKKISAIRHHYERLGRDFRVLTDDQIRIEPRLKNLRFLTKFQFNPGDFSGIQSEVIKTINEDPDSTIQSLAKIYGLMNVMVLIARGHIICDLNVDLFADINPVRLFKEDDNDSLLF